GAPQGGAPAALLRHAAGQGLVLRRDFLRPDAHPRHRNPRGLGGRLSSSQGDVLARKELDRFMANNVYLDSSGDDDFRRRAVYDGDLFVYSPRDSVRRFAEFAAGMIREAFDPLDPETAQFHLPLKRYA